MKRAYSKKIQSTTKKQRVNKETANQAIANFLYIYSTYKDIAYLISLNLSIRDHYHLAQTNKAIAQTVQFVDTNALFWKNQTEKMFPYLRLVNPDMNSFKKEYSNLQIKKLKPAAEEMQQFAYNLAQFESDLQELQQSLQKPFSKLMIIVHEGDLPALKKFCKEISEFKLNQLLTMPSANDLNPIKAAAARGDIEIFKFLYSRLLQSKHKDFWEKISMVEGAEDLYTRCVENRIPQQSLAACIVRGRNPAILEQAFYDAQAYNLVKSLDLLPQVAYWEGYYHVELINKLPLKYIDMEKIRVLGASASGLITEKLKEDENKVKKEIERDDIELNATLLQNCILKKQVNVIKQFLDWDINFLHRRLNMDPKRVDANPIVMLIRSDMDAMDNILLELIDNGRINVNHELKAQFTPQGKRTFFTLPIPHKLLLYVLWFRKNDLKKVALVEELIERGADLNNKAQAESLVRFPYNPFAMVPLFAAAMVNDMRSFKLLIAKGAQWDISIGEKNLKKALSEEKKVSRDFVFVIEEQYDHRKLLTAIKFNSNLNTLFDLAQKQKQEQAEFAKQLKEFLEHERITVDDVKMLNDLILNYYPKNMDEILTTLNTVINNDIELQQMEIDVSDSESEEESESASSESEKDSTSEEEQNTVRKRM